MKTVHFAYTTPFGNIINRALNLFIRKINITPPLYRYGNDLFIPWRKPIRSPHSISYNLLHRFKNFSKVKFYNFYEHTVCNIKGGDIFIGQPAPVLSKIPHEKIDYNSVTYRTIKKYPSKNNYIIMPYTHDPLYSGWWSELYEMTDNIILICGDIWTKNWANSPFYNLGKKNILRMDMAIDLNDYPVVKRRFNPKGKRKFLYIGHTSWYKNTKQLEQIADNYPDFEGGHIGRGFIKGWKKISEFTDLTPEYMSKIADEYDIFVNTSSSDPNATTIIEQMSLGFAVACTKETGYDYPSLFNLDIKDTKYNLEKLNEIQMTDEEKLLELGRENRKLVADKHNWQLFCDKIVNFTSL